MQVPVWLGGNIPRLFFTVGILRKTPQIIFPRSLPSFFLIEVLPAPSNVQGTGMQEVVLTVDLDLVLKNSQLLTHTRHPSLPQIATVQHSTESNGGKKAEDISFVSYSGLQLPLSTQIPFHGSTSILSLLPNLQDSELTISWNDFQRYFLMTRSIGCGFYVILFLDTMMKYLRLYIFMSKRG